MSNIRHRKLLCKYIKHTLYKDLCKKPQNEIISLRLGYNLAERKVSEFCKLYKKKKIKRYSEKENKCTFSARLEYEETQGVNKDKSQQYKKSYMC